MPDLENHASSHHSAGTKLESSPRVVTAQFSPYTGSVRIISSVLLMSKLGLGGVE